MFKLIINETKKENSLSAFFSNDFIENFCDKLTNISTTGQNLVTELTYPKKSTDPAKSSYPADAKIYKINIENEIYKPCKKEKTPVEKNKEIITPTAKLNYIKKLFKDDFKLNVSPNSELYDYINSYIYSSISKDEFFSTLKKLDYSAKDRYILYRIKGLIKTFLKTVIQPEKKILNKDIIISNFNNMIFNPITEELLLAHLLHYLNSYNNNNEYDLNFIINCKMDNKTVKQSKFKHLIDIFTPKETDNIELEKIKIMNVNEKYKYFYITKGNTYDKTKKTPEKLNELQFKLLISMSNNQINEYLQYLEKKKY